jgi:predicted ATPase/class 3 adenylate cyclase
VSDLPSGTVTFLFTDIEGSTKLLHELGSEGYAGALAEHRRILREAFGRYGGFEVDTQGDAFFVAFPTAPGALSAAADALAGLAPGPIRVRMGIHTGTPHLADGGYVGVDVHRAARIAGSGHGGQVLVSATTAALAGTEGLRDLGEHRLKDLSAPERLYQLGDGDFPPPKSLHQTNLPIPATPFLGRERELQQVLGLLESARLLTLTGPGGTGKTRLGLQAAAEASDRYPDGVFWVPLAPLRDPELVLETARQALGAKDGLTGHIANKSLLLLFDNFEHVVEAAAGLAELLAACPHLHLLVTSRELLCLPAEQAYPVPPLEPEDGTELFLARARAVEPGFAASAAVPELCARLEQLPLALELAAVRVRVLSPEQLLDRLSGRLDLFRAGRGVDPRQLTLRATIEWSHDLLAEDEQRLFARLAVFRGGCTLEAAEQVAEADLDALQSLVDKSLLRYSGERFWMLETIRGYAAERLDQQEEADAVRRRHAEYFLAIAVHARSELRGPKQAHWLGALEREIDNLRATLSWAIEEREYELALTVASSLERFWPAHGRAVEALTWFDGLLEASAPNVQPSTRARALWVAGRQAIQVHRTARAEALFEQAEPLLREVGERETLVYCLCELAKIRGEKGNASEATRLAEEALAIARQLGGARPVSAALDILATDAARHHDHVHALALLEESLALRRSLEDPTVVVSSLYTVALSALALGDEERARSAFAECLQLARELGHLMLIAASAANLGYLELFRGRIDEARSLLHEGLRLFSETGDEAFAADCVSGVATVAAAEGRPVMAVRLWAAVDAFFAATATELDEIDAAARNRFEAPARAALDAEERQKATEQGTRTPLDEAIGVALEASAMP